MKTNPEKRAAWETVFFLPGFLRWARSGGTDPSFDAEAYLRIHPEQRENFRLAVLLVKSLRIERPEADPKEMTFRLAAIRRQAYRRKRIRRAVWSAVATAAMLCGWIGYTLFIRPAPLDYAAALRETDSIASEITLTAGTRLAVVPDRAVIRIDNKGNVQAGGRSVWKAGRQQESGRMNRLTVPPGRRARLIFSDGTEVDVNAGTRIVYPEKFGPEKREIYVEGEIFIRVAPDRRYPFVVKTRDIDVTVLGTAFNLSTYREDKISSVVLVNGSVEVRTPEKKKIRLSPDRRFEYESGVVSVREVDVTRYICWKDGYLMFEEGSLDTILKRLSRYYGVSVVCNDPALARIVCKGKLELKDDLTEVLDRIAALLPVAYTTDGATVCVSTIQEKE